MTTQLQTVLDALETSKHTELTWVQIDEAIAIVRGMMQAEPVAWICEKTSRGLQRTLEFWEPEAHATAKITPLYAAPVAPQAVPAWLPIESAPKDGRDILVYFKTAGIRQVSWCDSDGDPKGEYAIWHVDDNKHGPYPLRGYCSGDETHWMPLPAAPAVKDKA